MSNTPIIPKPKSIVRRYWLPIAFTILISILALSDVIFFEKEKTIAKGFFGHPTIQALGWLATVIGLGYAIVQIVESASKLEAVAAATRAAKSSIHQQLLLDTKKLLKFAQTSINAHNIPVADGLLFFVIQKMQSVHWEAVSMGLPYNTSLTDEIKHIENARQKLALARSSDNPNDINDRLLEASSALNNSPETLSNIAESLSGFAAKSW